MEIILGKESSILKQYSTTPAPRSTQMVAVTICTFLNVSTFFSGSGLQIGKPRCPARVKVPSFDVRIVLGPRERSGERLNGYKVHDHGSDFRIFDSLSVNMGCS